MSKTDKRQVFYKLLDEFVAPQNDNKPETQKELLKQFAAFVVSESKLDLLRLKSLDLYTPKFKRPRYDLTKTTQLPNYFAEGIRGIEFFVNHLIEFLPKLELIHIKSAIDWCIASALTYKKIKMTEDTELMELFFKYIKFISHPDGQALTEKELQLLKAIKYIEIAPEAELLVRHFFLINIYLKQLAEYHDIPEWQTILSAPLYLNPAEFMFEELYITSKSKTLHSFSKSKDLKLSPSPLPGMLTQMTSSSSSSSSSCTSSTQNFPLETKTISTSSFKTILFSTLSNHVPFDMFKTLDLELFRRRTNELFIAIDQKDGVTTKSTKVITEIQTYLDSSLQHYFEKILSTRCPKPYDESLLSKDNPLTYEEIKHFLARLIAGSQFFIKNLPLFDHKNRPNASVVADLVTWVYDCLNLIRKNKNNIDFINFFNKYLFYNSHIDVKPLSDQENSHYKTFLKTYPVLAWKDDSLKKFISYFYNFDENFYLLNSKLEELILMKQNVSDNDMYAKSVSKNENYQKQIIKLLFNSPSKDIDINMITRTHSMSIFTKNLALAPKIADIFKQPVNLEETLSITP